jgi:hypothetical protein
VVFKCDAVLLVAVKTAVMRWQPGACVMTKAAAHLTAGARNPALQPSDMRRDRIRSVLLMPGYRRRCRELAQGVITINGLEC